MTIQYFDPIAWINRHFQEVGSEAANELFRAASNVACCRLGLVEMTATIVRKSYGESLERSLVETLLDNANADFASFLAVAVDEIRILEATEPAKHYRLRTMDAIHLACALSLGTETIMVSADNELLAAAVAAGLQTVNPSSAIRSS